MPSVALDGPADFAGWRRWARVLAARGVPPAEIRWETEAAPRDLFLADPAAPATDGAAGAITVPRAFLDLAEKAALHTDPDRFSLLYRLLWRIGREPGLMAVAPDADVARLGLLARAVRRDIHKMHAFVRFRAIGEGDQERYVAWFEPAHHIVEAAAPFFMRRFATMRWSILTPGRSAHWAGESLEFGPGARITDAPDGDPVEELWRRYYASVFNPARVNPSAMRNEMPKHFWRNLPEAALIKPLIDGARVRAMDMVEKAPTPPVTRRGADAPATPAPAAQEGLDAVRTQAMACRACPLWQPATQTVFGEGPGRARIMLVGEQPGDQEDLAGRPFVGPAGKLLDRALAEAGLDRAGLYVTNAVKHFKFVPRGKRRLHQKPGGMEIQACRPWLEQELDHVDPELVVALGATAAQSLFGRAMPIGASRGRLLTLGARRALITVHPSYLLRLPDRAAQEREYRAFVADLRLAAG